METTQTEHDTLELATADSTKQCVEGERSDIEQSEIESSDIESSEIESSDIESSDIESSDIESSDIALAQQDVKTEPDVLRPAKASTPPDGWVLCGIVARYILVSLYEASESALRRGLAQARAALAVVVRRGKAEIVTSNAVAGLILAAVFVSTSAMILLLEQVMPAWRAALVTSGIMAVIGFSLLQTQMVTDVTRAWVRAKSLRSEVAVRVTELVRAQLRERERVINRGGPV